MTSSKRTPSPPDPPDERVENKEGAAKATRDNDLSTGHLQAGDGGDDNSKRNKSKL